MRLLSLAILSAFALCVAACQEKPPEKPQVPKVATPAEPAKTYP
jgi:hypothetical protein